MAAAIACLAAVAVAGKAADSVATRPPTAAERTAAAAAALAIRWRSWPAGKIFPVKLGYDTDLLTNETATRVAISAQDSCGLAVDASLRGRTAADHCLAGLRATYLDQLQGIVYTIGVLAFPDSRNAASFIASLRSNGARLTGERLIALRALAVAGTASARFDDAARQVGTARKGGPFVILTVAGYADGRTAAATRESRASIFKPAAQLAADVIGPLTAPVAVDCHSSRQWSC